jgi:adenylate cyclase
MSDVFISYARSTEVHAKQVEQALSAVGYAVWRDVDLPAHGTYADVIEEQLTSAKAVVVLWSAEATKSQWVRAEANAAREMGTLIQARIDETIPPMPFNQIQCANLQSWDGSAAHAGWRKLQASVAALTGHSHGAEQAPTPQRHKTSVCVLPFANMSGDAEQEYFSDGISEDITTDLTKVSALAVTARNTAFMFKGQAVDVLGVARTLGVSHVLEGSVRKAANRLRITAQLIDGLTGDHLWAERYDRDLTDIFEIQDEISKAIVEALKVKLLPAEKKAIEQRGTKSAEAYNFYLMARKYWVSGNYGDIRREQRAIRLCQRAVEIDPNYAQAWALIALAEVSMHFYFDLQSEGALDAAERALSIDPTIAEAYAVRGRILCEGGDFEGAEREIATALKLGPDSWEVIREAARVAYAQRKIDDAAQYYERAVSLSDTDYHSWAMLLTFLQAKGDRSGVKHCGKMMLSQTEKVLAEDPSNGAALGIAAGGHAVLGNRERAMETIERALLIDPENLNMRYNFACVLSVHLGDHDAAMDLLEPILAESGSLLVKATAVDPDLDPLRGHPRFENMLAEATNRVGL